MNLSVTYVCMQTLEQGQAAYAHVFEIIKGLKKRGWHIDLIESSERYKISASYSGKTNKINILWKLLNSIHQQSSYNMDGFPKVYYVRFHFLTIVILLRAIRQKIPVVYEINGPFEDLFIAWPIAKKFRKALVYIMKYQLRKSAHIVAVTPQLALLASEIAGHKRVSVIPNGANTDIFRKTISTNYFNKYVIFFGALSAWQGIDTIIRALKLDTWPQDVAIMIVGDGEMAEYVKSESENDMRLIYMGRQNYDKLPDLISGALASISVQNNIADRAKTGLSPLKVYESLACGTPVIVSDLPGISELARDNKLGLVIPQNDPEALALAVSYINDNAALSQEMGIRGQKEVVENHSWDIRAEKTHETLLNLVNRL